jgi:hypothetical protein
VKQSVDRIVLRPPDEEPRRLWRRREDTVLLREETHRDERVQEPRGRAGVGGALGRGLGGGGPARHGREEVELEGGEEHTALQKAPRRCHQLVGHDAGGVPGRPPGPGPGPVRLDLRFQRGDVGVHEPRDRPSSREVLTHDLRHVGRLHAGVPHSVGIDDEVRAAGAQAERAAGGHLHRAGQALSRDLTTQRVDDRERSRRRARRRALGLSLVTGVDVEAEGFHGGPRTVRTARPRTSRPGAGRGGSTGRRRARFPPPGPAGR